MFAESTTYQFNRGFIKYTYAPSSQRGVSSEEKMSVRPRSLTSPAKDSLALAFKTRQSDATLFVVHSRTTDEFLNVTLVRLIPLVSCFLYGTLTGSL